MYTHRKEAGGEDVGDVVEQDAVDTAFATIRFASGAAGQLIITDASHGYSLGDSVVVGSEGTLYRPPSRQGSSPRIVREDGTAVEGDALLHLVPDFELDDVTSTLWDGERRMSSYEMDFRKIDAKILAIEYMDLAGSVADGRSPEVGSTEGMAALALAYGVMDVGRDQSGGQHRRRIVRRGERIPRRDQPSIRYRQVLGRTGFAVFGYREYRLFWIAAAFSNVGMWTLIYGRLWLMRSLTDSEILLGSVTAATMAPVMVFSVWGGVVADTVNRLRLLRFTRFLFAIAGLVTAVLIAYRCDCGMASAGNIRCHWRHAGIRYSDARRDGGIAGTKRATAKRDLLILRRFRRCCDFGTVAFSSAGIRRRHGRTLLHRLRVLCTYSVDVIAYGSQAALCWQGRRADYCNGNYSRNSW